MPNVLGIACVGEQRQQSEKSAQDILAFRHPGHGFDVQRMQREQRRHQRAPPGRRRQSPEQQEEQDAYSQCETGGS